MPVPTRWTRRARLGSWAGLLAILAVVVLAAPSMAAPAAPSLSRTFRAPYNGRVDSGWVGGSGGWGCVSANASLPEFNLTTGGLLEDNWATGCRNPGHKGWAQFTIRDYAGVDYLGFHVAKAGDYNLSALWTGFVWANLSVLLNRSAMGTANVSYEIWATTFLYGGRGTGIGTLSWTDDLANGSDGRGIQDHHPSFGKVAGPYVVWLNSGSYDVGSMLVFTMSGWVGAKAKVGAMVDVSLVSSGVRLKYVAVD